MSRSLGISSPRGGADISSRDLTPTASSIFRTSWSVWGACMETRSRLSSVRFRLDERFVCVGGQQVFRLVGVGNGDLHEPAVAERISIYFRRVVFDADVYFGDHA